MKKKIFLLLILSLASYVRAQNVIAPVAAGTYSDHKNAFVVGRIYIKPPVPLLRQNEQAAVAELPQEVIQEEKTQEALMFLYPNPVENTLYFETENKEPIHTVTIYEINGAFLYSGKVNNNSVDVSFLKKGSYFVQTNLDHIKRYTILKK